MAIVSLFALAALGVASPSSARAVAVRTYEANYASRFELTHKMIPPWARKYNVNCSHCHYPVPPRLNDTGLRFRWAGYRMPEEMGEKVEVQKVENYVGAAVTAAFEYDKTTGATGTSGFDLPAVQLFYAGPLGKNYAAFGELEFGEGEFDRIGTLMGVWGKEKSFGGLRGGMMHNFYEWGVAGFDREIGITAPTPMDGPMAVTNPFVFGEHALGLEGFYVMGSNRLSAEVLNGITPAGDVAGAGTTKDFLVTDQFLFDKRGSGVQVVGYYGSLNLDTLFNTSHFYRVGASANKRFEHLEVIGAVVVGKDYDLPAGAPEEKSLGWWGTLQYAFPSNFTLYGRYESLDPNTSVSNDGNNRFVLGAALPVTLPEYLKMGLEYHLDQPQLSGAPKTNAIALQAALAF